MTSVAVATTPSPVCQRLDATEQIGCLVLNSGCSTGFAGMASTDLNPGTVAMKIASVSPSVATVQNWADNTSPAYAFSRGLFLSTLVGFGNIGESATAHNGSCSAFAGDEGFGRRPIQPRQVPAPRRSVGLAVVAAGFVPLPGFAAPYGIPCATTPNSVPVASRVALGTNSLLCK